MSSHYPFTQKFFFMLKPIIVLKEHVFFFTAGHTCKVLIYDC